MNIDTLVIHFVLIKNIILNNHIHIIYQSLYTFVIYVPNIVDDRTVIEHRK